MRLSLENLVKQDILQAPGNILIMQCLRSSFLGHFRVNASLRNRVINVDDIAINNYGRLLCTTTGNHSDQIMTRVIGLVKKFDNIDAAKVTEMADFQKDLSLDSLDRVELVMSFEQEFSIEIPDDEAEKLKCCADVAKYILSESDKKPAE
ncbi:hypothetical protein V2J09_003335 [Rumex salicifolius]